MCKRVTKEDFIQRSVAIHGNKYSYASVEWVNTHTKVLITCPKHGDFLQSPDKHLHGRGCPKCKGDKTRESRMLSNEEFLRRARLAHGDKYEYDLSTYTGMLNKIRIICPVHGEFWQKAQDHLKGCGCSRCLNKIQTQEDFLKKAKEVWGDRYDLSQAVYTKSNNKIKVICKEHGAFYPTANNFLRGHGCPECGLILQGEKRRKDTDYFIEEARKIHGNKYDYSRVNYTINRRKVEIICPIHGSFMQKANDHLCGKGCPKCSGTQKSNTEEFIQKANVVHNGEYDYSLVEYKGNKNKVKIICRKHGIFEQKPNSHLSGEGCPVCQESQGEKAVRRFLESINIKFVQEKIFDDCKDIGFLRFDFYLPDYNTCIEFQGKQHYKNEPFFDSGGGFEGRLKRDEIKRRYCAEKKITLIEIKYNENVKLKLDKLWNTLL